MPPHGGAPRWPLRLVCGELKTMPVPRSGPGQKKEENDAKNRVCKPSKTRSFFGLLTIYRKKTSEPPRALDIPPLQSLQGLNYVEDDSPPFIPKKYDTVAYLGFSGDFDPHLMQYYKYDDQHVASFFKCSARQVQDDPAFPVQFLAFADSRGKAVKDEIAAQRERLKELTSGTEDRLLRLFFRLVYPTYPIVDRKKFFADYSKGSENIDICLYSGLLAISVIWNKYDEELCVKNLPRQLYDKLFDECSIAVERSLKHPTLGTVQGLLLLAQKHIIQSDNATLFSANLHMAKLVSVSHTLGLHLDCANWSISPSEKRLRKRIWATVYMIEKWTSANLGSPSILTHENTTWDEYEEEDPSSLLFVHFGKLTRILDGILKDLYSVRDYAQRYNDPENTIAIVDRYFVTLHAWRDQLPAELKEMSYLQENELKKNGILHLAELTIAVLLHRIKLHPSCTRLLKRSSLRKYREQAAKIIKFIVKYTSDIDNPHLKSFWHSMVRLNFSTLLSFVLFHHITSTSKREFEETRLTLNRWSKTLQGLSKSWAGGTGLAVERASTVFMSGDHGNLFGHNEKLVLYTQETERLYQEWLTWAREQKAKKLAAEAAAKDGYESSHSSGVKEELESPITEFFVPDLAQQPQVQIVRSQDAGLQQHANASMLDHGNLQQHHNQDVFDGFPFVDSLDYHLNNTNNPLDFGNVDMQQPFIADASAVHDPDFMQYLRHLQGYTTGTATAMATATATASASASASTNSMEGSGQLHDFASFWSTEHFSS